MVLSWLSGVDDGKVIYTTYLEALIQAINGKLVVNGCNVSADGTDMSVTVAAGTIEYEGSEYAVSETNVSISAAESDRDRIDVVVWDYNDGSPTVTVVVGARWIDDDGVLKPISERINDSQIPLAIVRVPANATAIQAADITDVRATRSRLWESLNVDVINEKTSDAGVTIDGCLIKDGVVANADKLDGYEASDFEMVANKGVANGYAPLDSNALVPVGNIPDLTRSKITDFFDSPFWDNIPDKPSTYPSELSKVTIDTDKNWGGYQITNIGKLAVGAAGFTSENEKLRVAGKIVASSYIIEGYGNGGVALTHNDGYGNANVVFNHVAGVPEQDGNAARIVVNTDSTTGANIEFQVKSGVTAGTAVALTKVLRLYESYAQFLVDIQPYSDNTRNIGTSSKRFKDGYFAGTVYTGDVEFKNKWRIAEYDEDGNVMEDGLRVINSKGEEIFKITEDGLWFKGKKIV